MGRELARPRVPRTPFARFLRACDAAARGDPSGRTRWAWLALTPSPALLSLARRMPDLPPPAGPQVPAAPTRGGEPDPLHGAVLPSGGAESSAALTHALEATLRLPRRGVRQQVAAAADAWERALDDAHVQAQISSLAGAAPDPVTAVRARVVDLLAERLEATVDPGDPAEPGGELYQEVVWRAADQRDVELAWLADDLGARTAAARELPLIEEVRAFCALAEAYERVVEMAPDRASPSFPRLYYPVVRHTVWLHNRRAQAPVANAMYRVELRFAELCAHDSGVALLTKNLACGP
jgi:hypothetical protein